MAWLVPENMLDDQQRDFVENVNIDERNVWIKGFPGSGKSVLLAYTLMRIKRKTPDAKIAVVVYTHALIAMFKAAFAEMGIASKDSNNPENPKIMTYYQFIAWDSSAYDYILSDEIQDLSGSVLSAMNSRAKHVIVAGDHNQSIYERIMLPKQSVESTVTPAQVASLLSCRDFELGIIHRLSSSIIAAVEKLMPNMNIFSARRDMTKKNTQIRLCTANSETEEIQYILREAQRAVNIGETAAILIPARPKIVEFIRSVLGILGKQPWQVILNEWGEIDFYKMNEYLRANGVQLQYVGNRYGSFLEGNGLINLMTYHSSKGLDFDNVFLPGLTKDFFIDETKEQLNRTLFMVAMTRSRNNLYLTYNGSPYEYLTKFADDCSKINIHNLLNGKPSTTGGDNIFGI